MVEVVFGFGSSHRLWLCGIPAIVAGFRLAVVLWALIRGGPFG